MAAQVSPFARPAKLLLAHIQPRARTSPPEPLHPQLLAKFLHTISRPERRYGRPSLSIRTPRKTPACPYPAPSADIAARASPSVTPREIPACRIQTCASLSPPELRHSQFPAKLLVAISRPERGHRRSSLPIRNSRRNSCMPFPTSAPISPLKPLHSQAPQKSKGRCVFHRPFDFCNTLDLSAVLWRSGPPPILSSGCHPPMLPFLGPLSCPQRKDYVKDPLTTRFRPYQSRQKALSVRLRPCHIRGLCRLRTPDEVGFGPRRLARKPDSRRGRPHGIRTGHFSRHRPNGCFLLA